MSRLTGIDPEREKRMGARCLALIALTGLTGFVTYFWPSKSALWQQWLFLVHTGQGLGLAGLLALYIYMHFRRTLALRRPGMALAGIVAAGISLVFVATGLQIAVYGQTEAHRAIYWTHVISGSAALLAVVAHIVLHWAAWPASRPTPRPKLFSLSPVTLRWSLGAAAIALVIVTFGAGAHALLPSPYHDVAAIQPYDLSRYGPDPFEPSKNKTASGGFYDARRLAVSDDCGTCHTDIYKEWRSSIHAKAGADRAYQTNVNLLATKKGIEATRYCEGCHAPVAIMSGQLSKGGRLDTFGHMREGVGCLGCHGIDKINSTAGVASYTLRPPAPYLFAGYDNALARTLNHYLVRLNPALHRREMARSPLPQSEMCSVCHAQFMEKVMNDWGWVKMQDDYISWLNGPFSGQSKHTFARGDVTRCQDCHFDKVLADDPSADQHGLVRSHRSLGANTAIPHIDGDDEHLRLTAQFLQANKVTVSIDKPTRGDNAVRNDRYVAPDIAHLGESLSYYYLGEEATINVVVSNIGVGHDFPGGTSDINEAWVRFVATDAQGTPIYESGAVGPDGAVDPQAYFYRSMAVDKSGELVWRHDLFRMVGDSYKKVIEPGSADVVTYRVKVPEWAKSPMNLYAVVCYRKLNDRYAKWALKDEHIRLPIVDVASDTLKVPLREKTEVVAGQLDRRSES
ncbi:MAG TPA: multiheme c-type cytochrome [Steroidobacteraceae bacterium]|nr:multiheme c-type cytochrome [Steroidobacteraceae bacterium]